MPNDQTKIEPNLFGHPVRGPLFCAIAFSPSNAIANTLKGPFREGPLFSKVSFRKKRTLNGVLYLNWLSESILLATLLEKTLFSSQKIFYERVFNSCPESEISFILFTFLWASSYCNCRRFQRPFFLAYLWLGMEKGASFLLVTPEFFTSIPYLGMWTLVNDRTSILLVRPNRCRILTNSFTIKLLNF